MIKKTYIICVAFMFLFVTVWGQIDLVFPKNNQILSTNDVILRWNKFFSIDTYEYEINISTDSISFDNQIVFNTSTSFDSVILNLTSNRYYWRVRAVKNQTTYPWSTIQAFLIFKPTDIEGCILWLSPDSGIIEDINGVSKWINYINDTSSAIQNTNNYKPVKISNAINGRHTLRFDGTNDHMLIPLRAFNEYSCFSIVNPKPNKKAYDIYLSSNYRNEARYAFCVGSHPTIGGGMMGNSSNYTQCGNSDYAIIGKFHILTTAKRGNKWDFYCNSNFIRTINRSEYPTYNGYYNWGLGVELINGVLDNNTFLGELSETIIYNSGLSDSLQKLVEKYIDHKYYPPANLGKDIVSYSFCINQTLSPGNYFSSYLWSTGATTSTISVTKTGKYWVKTTDMFGYQSSDTINIYNPLPFNQLPKTKGLCQNESLVWDTNYPTENYSFLWQNNSTNNKLTISDSGYFHVKITDSQNCIFNSDTVHIVFDNYPTTASLGNDTTICSGNLIFLKNKAEETISYLWYNGSTNDSIVITNSGQYSLTSTNINGCIRKDTVNITINGIAPTALFSYTHACKNQTNFFTDLSYPPNNETITQREWYWGDNNTTSAGNTTVFNYQYADTGTYKVKLVITSNTGCISEKTNFITVAPYPVASYTTSALCENYIIEFAGFYSTFGYPIDQWKWNFDDIPSGDNNIVLSQNSLHKFSTYGDYNVVLIATNNYNCSDTVSQLLTVKPAPTADYIINSSTCSKNSISFLNTSNSISLNPIQGYYWNFGNERTSALQNPTQTYSLSGTYNVKLVVNSSNGCIDSITKPITVRPLPVTDFNYSATCIDNPIFFTNNSTITSGSITSWKWDFGDETSSNQQSPQHTYSDTVTTYVKLVAISNYSCKDSVTKSFTVHPSPVATFTSNYMYGSPPLNVSLTNTSTGANNNVWIINTDTISQTDINYTFNNLGAYPVTLSVYNNYGCYSNLSKTIEVLEPKIDVQIVDIVSTINEGYLTIDAQILNKSSMDISTMDMMIQASETGIFTEQWSGKLVKDGLLLYNYSNKIPVNNLNQFICMNVLSVNNLDDVAPSDNSRCEALTITDFQVLAPYPNPARSALTIPIIANTDREILVELYSTMGELVKDQFSTSSAGASLSFITIDITGVNPGFYLLKIKSNNEQFLKSIVIQ